MALGSIKGSNISFLNTASTNNFFSAFFLPLLLVLISSSSSLDKIKYINRVPFLDIQINFCKFPNFGGPYE